ncbi:MAG: GC-type dockerin domain-anchored protein [Phycisphaerales bacterium JB040]
MRTVLAIGVLGVMSGAAPAQDVEILDYIGMAGLSFDASGAFDFVRPIGIPFEVDLSDSVFPTTVNPGGSYNSTFTMSAGPGTLELRGSTDGAVFQPAGDAGPDGPFAVIGLIVTTGVPLTYTLEASVSIGVGAGDSTNTPYVIGSIDDPPCFDVGANPAPGAAFCSSGASALYTRVHLDPGGFFTSLDECCPAVTDRGESEGVLEPGTYSFFIQVGAQMEPFFGPGGDSSGYASILLEWDAPPCEPDLNDDGVLDLGDIQFFVGLFLGGDVAADITGDGVLVLGDVQAFVGLYQAGC